MHHPQHPGITARAVTAAESEAAQTLVSMRGGAVAVALLGLTSHVHQSPLFTRIGAARTEVIKLFRTRTKVTGLVSWPFRPVISEGRNSSCVHSERCVHEAIEHRELR